MSAQLSTLAERARLDQDFLSPAPPRAPYFDPELGAWVLSRYADVQAALREPALCQQGRPGGEGNVRGQVFAALPHARLAEWKRAIEPLALGMIAALPADRPIDLVREFIQPWTRAVAMLVLDATPAQKRRLDRLARYRSSAAARSTVLRKVANVAFELFFRNRAADKSVFIGISETLPGFLANAWFALLQHRTELLRLRIEPELLPGAIEELLRYAGLVHSLARRAASNIDIGGIGIATGDLVILKLASANRDPEQFSNPDFLDLTRRVTGHVALGMGPHFCAGAMLLRTAAAIATSAFVQRSAAAEISGVVEWSRGSTLVSPSSLPVILRS